MRCLAHAALAAAAAASAAQSPAQSPAPAAGAPAVEAAVARICAAQLGRIDETIAIDWRTQELLLAALVWEAMACARALGVVREQPQPGGEVRWIIRG